MATFVIDTQDVIQGDVNNPSQPPLATKEVTENLFDEDGIDYQAIGEGLDLSDGMETETRFYTNELAARIGASIRITTYEDQVDKPSIEGTIVSVVKTRGQETLTMDPVYLCGQLFGQTTFRVDKIRGFEEVAEIHITHLEALAQPLPASAANTSTSSVSLVPKPRSRPPSRAELNSRRASTTEIGEGTFVITEGGGATWVPPETQEKSRPTSRASGLAGRISRAISRSRSRSRSKGPPREVEEATIRQVQVENKYGPVTGVPKPKGVQPPAQWTPTILYPPTTDTQTLGWSSSMLKLRKKTTAFPALVSTPKTSDEETGNLSSPNMRYRWGLVTNTTSSSSNQSSTPPAPPPGTPQPMRPPGTIRHIRAEEAAPPLQAIADAILHPKPRPATKQSGAFQLQTSSPQVKQPVTDPQVKQPAAGLKRTEQMEDLRNKWALFAMNRLAEEKLAADTIGQPPDYYKAFQRASSDALLKISEAALREIKFGKHEDVVSPRSLLRVWNQLCLEGQSLDEAGQNALGSFLGNNVPPPVDMLNSPSYEDTARPPPVSRQDEIRYPSVQQVPQPPTADHGFPYTKEGHLDLLRLLIDYRKFGNNLTFDEWMLQAGVTNYAKQHNLVIAEPAMLQQLAPNRNFYIWSYVQHEGCNNLPFEDWYAMVHQHLQPPARYNPAFTADPYEYLMNKERPVHPQPLPNLIWGPSPCSDETNLHPNKPVRSDMDTDKPISTEDQHTIQRIQKPSAAIQATDAMSRLSLRDTAAEAKRQQEAEQNKRYRDVFTTMATKFPTMNRIFWEQDAVKANFISDHAIDVPFVKPADFLPGGRFAHLLIPTYPYVPSEILEAFNICAKRNSPTYFNAWRQCYAAAFQSDKIFKKSGNTDFDEPYPNDSPWMKTMIRPMRRNIDINTLAKVQHQAAIEKAKARHWDLTKEEVYDWFIRPVERLVALNMPCSTYLTKATRDEAAANYLYQIIWRYVGFPTPPAILSPKDMVIEMSRIRACRVDDFVMRSAQDRPVHVLAPVKLNRGADGKFTTTEEDCSLSFTEDSADHPCDHPPRTPITPGGPDEWERLMSQMDQARSTAIHRVSKMPNGREKNCWTHFLSIIEADVAKYLDEFSKDLMTASLTKIKCRASISSLNKVTPTMEVYLSPERDLSLRTQEDIYEEILQYNEARATCTQNLDAINKILQSTHVCDMEGFTECRDEARRMLGVVKVRVLQLTRHLDYLQNLPERVVNTKYLMADMLATGSYSYPTNTNLCYGIPPRGDNPAPTGAEKPSPQISHLKVRPEEEDSDCLDWSEDDQYSSRRRWGSASTNESNAMDTAPADKPLATSSPQKQLTRPALSQVTQAAEEPPFRLSAPPARHHSRPASTLPDEAATSLVAAIGSKAATSIKTNAPKPRSLLEPAPKWHGRRGGEEKVPDWAKVRHAAQTLVQLYNFTSERDRRDTRKFPLHHVVPLRGVNRSRLLDIKILWEKDPYSLIITQTQWKRTEQKQPSTSLRIARKNFSAFIGLLNTMSELVLQPNVNDDNGNKNIATRKITLDEGKFKADVITSIGDNGRDRVLVFEAKYAKLKHTFSCPWIHLPRLIDHLKELNTEWTTAIAEEEARLSGAQ